MTALAQVGREVAAPGGVAEAEPPGRLLAHLAPVQELLPGLARRQRPEDVLVVLGGEPVQLEQAPAQLGPLLRRAAALGQLHPGHLGQDAEGADEVSLLDLLDESEHVAALLAAEAVPRLLLLGDVEARRLLGVEGAEAPELAPLLTEPYVLLDDVYEVQPRPDLVTRVLRRQRAHDCTKYYQGQCALARVLPIEG